MALRTLTAAVGWPVDTAAGWTASNNILPAGMPGFESDTKKFKIGDGATRWNVLEYRSIEVFTTAFKNMLSQANNPNGVAVLDDNGKLLASQLPIGVSGTISWYADITARNATDPASRTGLFYVFDATGDPSVTAGAAYYAWDDVNSAWKKLGETESLDISVTNYFNLTTNTLDDINDGTTYVRMTPAERNTITSLGTDAVKVTDNVVIQGPSAATLASWLGN